MHDKSYLSAIGAAYPAQPRDEAVWPGNQSATSYSERAPDRSGIEGARHVNRVPGQGREQRNPQYAEQNPLGRRGYGVQPDFLGHQNVGEFSQRRHGWLERHAGLTIFILGLALFVFIGTVPLSIELYKFWRYDNGPAQTMKSCQVVGSNVVQPGGTLQTTCLYTKRKRCIGTVEYRLIGVSSDTGKQIMDIIGNYKAAWPGGVDVVQNQNIRIPKDVRPGRYTMRWFADYTHCPAADGRKETSPNWRWRDKSPALIIDVVAPAPHQLDWSADAIE